MRRTISLFVCVIFWFSMFASPVSAMSDGMLIPEYQAENGLNSFEKFSVLDGKIYTFSYKGEPKISLYNPEDKSLTPVFSLDPTFSLAEMYSFDGHLILLDYHGKVLSYNPADGNVKKESKLPISLDDASVECVIYAENKPILQIRNDANNSILLYWADGSGRKEKLPKKSYFTSISPYKDGTFLGAGYEGISLIKDGKAEMLDLPELQIPFHVGVFFYKADEEKLYFSQSNYLYELNENFEIKIVGFLPFSAESFIPCQFIDNSLYYMVEIEDSESQLQILSLDTLFLPEQIVRVSGMDSRMSNAYNKANPDFPIASTGFMAWDLENDPVKLATNMKGEDAADVYFLYDYDVEVREALSKHGYAESLECSEALMALYDKFYPYLKKSISYEGKPYFFPYHLRLSHPPFEYNVKGLEELGFYEEDLPKTYLDFVKFVKALEPLTEDGDLKIFEMEEFVNHKREILFTMLEENFGLQLRSGDPVQFNNPEFVEILEQISAIQFDRLSSGKGFGSGGDIIDMPEFLFPRSSKYAGVSPGFKPLPLSISEDSEPIFLVKPAIAFVNVLSPNKTAAIAFLERFAKTLDPVTETYLYTDKTEPILDPYRLRNIQNLEKKIAEIEKNLANPSNKKKKKAMEQDLRIAEKQLEDSKKKTYLLSPEDIAYYKANHQYYYVLKEQFLDFKNEQLRNLLERFYLKQIDIAGFLNELDRIVNMALLEGK